MSTLTMVQRQRLSAESFADPVNRRYVVQDQADLNAVAAQLSRAANPEAIRVQATRIARTTGLKLPDDWRDPRVNQGRAQIAIALAHAARHG